MLPGSWRNFSGKNDSGYNGSGRREITIKLNADYDNPEANVEMQKIKEDLLNTGYVIKVREPRPEDLQRVLVHSKFDLD